jgi:N-acetylglucosamine-6-phosphate deacetylase
MATRNPAEFLKLGGVVGRIAPGQRANFALIDDELNVHDTWIDGVQASAQ